MENGRKMNIDVYVWGVRGFCFVIFWAGGKKKITNQNGVWGEKMCKYTFWEADGGRRLENMRIGLISGLFFCISYISMNKY